MDPNEQQQPPPQPEEQEPSLPPAEQMRARRLAKLGGAAATSSTSSAPPSTTSSSSPAVAAAVSGKHPQQTENTGAPVASPASSSVSMSTRLSSDAGTTATLSSRPVTAASETKPVGPSTQDQGTRPQKMIKRETPEEWADKTVSHFFRVSLDPNRKLDVHGHELTFLPNIRAELEEAGSPILLSTDSLDSIILEAGSAFPLDKPLLDYLLPCWKRIVKFTKMQRDPSPEKQNVLKEARRLCMSYSAFALTMPDLFGREENPKHDTIVPYLLRDLDHESGMCLEFVGEAVTRFQDDEAFEQVFVNAMLEISTKLARMNMSDDFKRYVNALVLYSKYKELMTAVAMHPCFVMSTSAPNIEKMTILGPFFRLSPLQPDFAKTYFPNPTTLDDGRVRSAQSAMQIILATHQMDLLAVINNFVRVGSEVRSRVLDWFALVVNSNHKRRAMQVDPKEVSSDGFMLNVTAIIDGLCQPFMDTTFSKIGRIDIDYLRRQPRVDISDETKLNADQNQSDKFYGNEAGGTSNFISEVFFLALAAHNYGTEAISDKLKNLDRHIDSFRRNLESFEAERPRFQNNPAHLHMFNQRTERYREALDMSMALKHATIGVLSDEKMQGKSLQFMRYVTVWLLRVASQTEFTPDAWLKLPLPTPPPEAFSCLPEYALQIILDNFKFAFNTVPQVLMSSVGDELMILCITLLESSEYIRNPYMKSALVTLLYFGVTQWFRHWKNGVMTDVLMGSKFANEYLLHALMKFYIECESTGAHTQFYDKFNIRFEIFYIIQKVWPNVHYHRQLIRQSKVNRAFFVRFVNMLLNDATYVLDEALTKFQKIHELQEQLKETGLSEEDRTAKQDELKTVEGHATSYMHLTNQTVSMMKLFTEALGDSFTMPEIVQRLAGMLDYNLETLVGPKSIKLKVEDPRKYRFEPKTLLTGIVDIYLNLGKQPAFIEAVAADGRSYKPETFSAASRILGARVGTDPSKVAQFDRLAAKFAAAKELADQAELDFGEVPAEFEDPLMSDLMKDPVQLPSGNVVDRSTIMQHLLSDPKDPFTRQPMTIEDVVPRADLRQQIEAWKAERIEASRKSKLAAIADVDVDVGVDAMDTTTE